MTVEDRWIGVLSSLYSVALQNNSVWVSEHVTRQLFETLQHTFFCIGVVESQVKIDTLSHFVLQDDLALDVPYRNGSSIKGDARGFTLRLELVIDGRGRHFVGTRGCYSQSMAVNGRTIVGDKMSREAFTRMGSCQYREDELACKVCPSRCSIQSKDDAIQNFKV